MFVDQVKVYVKVATAAAGWLRFAVKICAERRPCRR